MKKNDSMGYVAYALMLAVAVLVGFLVIRPDFASSSIKFNGIALILIAIVVGIILTALMVELGHLVGAKMGHYQISSWICLGLGFKRKKDGKMNFTASNFDGLTGETIVVPKDSKKSNPHPMIIMPFVFILLEVIGMVVLIIVSSRLISDSGDTSYAWLRIAAEGVLTVAGMILIYDIFPAALDSKNDGYLLTVLNHKINVEAYNAMLVAQDCLAKGLPIPETPVYDNVTDFTASVNDVTLYSDLSKGDFEGALSVVEKTINCRNQVSSNVYKVAMAQKVAIIIYTKPLEEAKKYFVALPLADKKYLASISSAAGIRAYVLANGLIEESISETTAALEKSDSVLHKLPKDKRTIEKHLLKDAVAKVLLAHPDWDLSAYGYGVKEEPKAEVKEEPKEVAKDANETKEEKK